MFLRLFQIYFEQFPEPAQIKTTDHSWDIFLALVLITAITFFIQACTDIYFVSKEKMIGIHVTTLDTIFILFVQNIDTHQHHYYYFLQILLAMNGITMSKHLTSWIVSGSLLNAFHATILIFLFSFQIFPPSYRFLNYSNTFLIWLLLFLNAIHTLVFALHLSSYFSKRKRTHHQL